MLSDDKVSIIIPTYNESDNIEELIERLESTLLNINSEIIIVDDDSPDNTASIAENMKNKFKNIIVIIRKNKKGLSSAIIEGINISSGKFIAIMDADLQHPPEILKCLYKKILNHKDIIIASRYSGVNVTNWSLLRKLISKTAIFLSHTLFPKIKSISDPMSGYFIFKKEILNNIILNPIGFKILLEILIKTNYKSIEEIPYEFGIRKHNKSKLGILQIISFIKHIFLLTNYRPIKYAIVGTLGILINEFLLYYLSLKYHLFLSSIIAIESSIIINFLFNDIWTFRKKGKPKIFLLRYINYHSLVLFGALINFVTLISLTKIGINFLISNIIGIFIGFIFNYINSENFVWHF